VALQDCSREQLQQVFDALSSCAQLTKLHMFNDDMDPGEPHPSVNLSGMQVHRQLSKLRQLQELTLSQIRWDHWGPRQLTVLSALTKLRLEYCHMSDTGLAVMLQRLTGLRDLHVGETLPANELLLAMLGGLSNLESCLRLYNAGGFSFTDEVLALLSPLTKLTCLELYGANDDSFVSADAERAFLAGMPHVDRISWF
jgi:hypothetical protein